MPPPQKLPPTQVLDRLIRRLEKRIEALQRVKFEGHGPVITELEVERIHPGNYTVDG